VDSGEAARGFRDDPARGCGGLLACGFLTPDWREGQAWERVRRHYELSKRLLAAVAAPVGLWLPGGYANLLAPHDREQARDAYGSNSARLRSLKRRFDPGGVFAPAVPLPD
jgi:hypothetical protein